MDGIFETNDSFDFSKLILTKPTMISGGNYFIRCLVDNSPLYIQPPKCSTKQGILKAGKRFYTDLMFTNENEDFIRWMENLENHCQQYIFKNREKWFDGEMEIHDVENYFTSPLKLYKSGKYYIARANLSVVLNRPTLKIYDEHENEVNMETISDKTNVITILEIQGIKCSARSFQIELEVKQMMVLKPNDLFEKCIIATSKKPAILEKDKPDSLYLEEPIVESNEEIVDKNVHESIDESENEIVIDTLLANLEHNNKSDNETHSPNLEINPTVEKKDELEEISFTLEELKDTEPLQLKKRNDVYYEMYREARRKAKVAKDLALSSYLEAKRIKNIYMLEDIEDSDDSDLEIDGEDSLEN
jgi:hypothetical protein